MNATNLSRNEKGDAMTTFSKISALCSFVSALLVVGCAAAPASSVDSRIGEELPPDAQQEQLSIDVDVSGGVSMGSQASAGALETPPVDCGNGVIDAGESCDDGDTESLDGCSRICQAEPGFLCVGEPSDCLISCGDAVANNGEACDDGNRVNGDGCDNNCTASACGNGVRSGREGCDDGNSVDGDGCDSNCAVTVCGNGVVTAGELCDDGNAFDGDGCDGNCTETACGNDISTQGESCDDGNLVDGDGCSSACSPEV